MKNIKVDTKRQLYLSDLFWFIITRWRAILIGAVIGAALMAAFSLGKSLKGNSIKTYYTEAELNTMKQALSQDDRTRAELCISLKDQYDEASDRSTESGIMRIDASCAPTQNVSYYLKTEDAAAVIEAYRLYILSDEMMEYLAGITDGMYDKTDLSMLISVAGNGNTFTVTTISDSKQMCETISSGISEKMTLKKSDISKKIAHEMSNVDVEYSENYSEALAKYQDNIINRVSTTKKAYTTARDKLSPASMSYVNAYIMSDGKTGPAPTVKASVSKKYVAVGFIGGLAIVVIVYIFGYVYSNKMTNPEDGYQIWELPIIAKIVDNTKRTRNFILDRRIRRHKYGVASEDNDETINYIVSRIELFCRKNQLEKVALASSVSEDKYVAELYNSVAELALKNGITVTGIGNMGKHIEAMDTATDIGNVIIVERAEVSYYSDIDREVVFAQGHGVKLLGMITVL